MPVPRASRRPRPLDSRREICHAAVREAHTRLVAVAAVISAVRRPLSPRRPTDSTDAQLARWCAAEGEWDSAFEAIYDRYAPGLLVFCRQLLGSREEAEDALQQSLVRAYGALRAGRDPGCLKASRLSRSRATAA